MKAQDKGGPGKTQQTSWLKRLPQASTPAALGGLLSLAAQGLLALFLLGLFDAAAVGIFSTLSQIAFGWATLALAQSHMSVLANHGRPATQVARHAWRQSLWRLLGISPVVLGLLFWSQPGASLPFAASLAWATGLALTQMTWFMAQSLCVRALPPLHTGLVRCVPPILAALATWAWAHWLDQRSAATLLGAALLGYASGALWFLPAWQAAPGSPGAAAAGPAQVATAHRDGDDRSTRLKLIHTLVDMSTSTLLAVQWTRLHGAAEAAYLLMLLRIFGFIPGLVHTAWSQILLGSAQTRQQASGRVALLATLLVAVTAVLLQLALHYGWLGASWQGMSAYLLPLCLWQMCACANAAHFHLAFLSGRARAYSLQCIGINGTLIALLLLLPGWSASPLVQLHALAVCMCLSLGAQLVYLRRA